MDVVEEKKLREFILDRLLSLIDIVKKNTNHHSMPYKWPQANELQNVFNEFCVHILSFNPPHHAQEFKMIFIDGVFMFFDQCITITENDKYYGIYTIVQIFNRLARQEFVRYGDYIDMFFNILERCTLMESVDLCYLLCDQKELLQIVMEQEKSGTLRIARARFLSLINAFERKILGAVHNDKAVLTRLRALCFELLPINFQGLCNKGIRDAPGRHFVLKSIKPPTIPQAQVKRLETTEKSPTESKSTTEDNGETLIDEENNNNNNRLKKRRRVADTSTYVSDFESDLTYIYNHWETILEFIQNSATFLMSSTIAEGNKCFSGLNRIINLLAERPHEILQDKLISIPESDIFLPLIKHQRQAEKLPLCCMEKDDDQVHSCSDYTTKSLYLLPLLEKGSLLAFQQAWTSMSFRRCLLMCITAMFRLLCSPKYSMKSLASSQNNPNGENLVALAELLATPLASSFHTLKKNIVKLFVTSPSCFKGFPPLRLEGIPWFAICPMWQPPFTLAQLVDELTHQESHFVGFYPVINNQWKKNGCPDRSPVEWYEPVKETFSVIDNDTVVPENLLEHSQAFYFKSPVPALSYNARGSQPKLQQRHRTYITEFLPILGLLNENESAVLAQEGFSRKVKVIGCDDLVPPTFDRERAEWCLSESDAETLSRTATVPEKLIKKWNDYKEKVISDEDPINQIEASEKIVKNSVFQWRCDRLLSFTNLQLYDYSNQNRELRVKIREANLEDLIRAAIQRESKSALPVVSR